LKFIELYPFADPEFAARKLMEIANTIEPVLDGRNPSFLRDAGSPAEYGSDLKRAIELGWRSGCMRAAPPM
jgi:hypothetical protein